MGGGGGPPPEFFKIYFSGMKFLSNLITFKIKTIFGSIFQAKYFVRDNLMYIIWFSNEEWGPGTIAPEAFENIFN